MSNEERIDKILGELEAKVLFNKFDSKYSDQLKAELTKLKDEETNKAVLEGQIKETEYWRKSGFLPLFDADKRLSLLETELKERENSNE